MLAHPSGDNAAAARRKRLAPLPASTVRARDHTGAMDAIGTEAERL